MIGSHRAEDDSELHHICGRLLRLELIMELTCAKKNEGWQEEKRASEKGNSSRFNHSPSLPRWHSQGWAQRLPRFLSERQIEDIE